MYTLSWYLPRVLQLTITDDYTLEDVNTVNEQINEELDDAKSNLLLLIDVSKMNRPYNFTVIRDRQTFKDHHNLQHIYVVASDNIIKLAMMVIFHLSRAQLSLVTDMDNATRLITKHLDHSK